MTSYRHLARRLLFAALTAAGLATLTAQTITDPARFTPWLRIYLADHPHLLAP